MMASEGLSMDLCLSPAHSGGDKLGALHHAHQLSKMRVTSNGRLSADAGNARLGNDASSIPVTPATPVAVTPSFFNFAGRMCEDHHLYQDLQLAAELGKTLLERNKSLEATIHHQQNNNEEQLLQIEYLNKQTAALREVNDSRLQIYEQLEISVADLEKTNQRYKDEAEGNKRKIKYLSSTIESLESRNDELQRSLEEARSHAAASSRDRSPTLKDVSTKTVTVPADRNTEAEQQAEEEVLCLQAALSQAQSQTAKEVKRREATELDLAAIAEEYQELQEQVSILQERQNDSHRTFDEELRDLDSTNASHQQYCAKCMEALEDNLPAAFRLNESLDDDPTMRSQQCALVRLKNGAMAWGSQESLASMGQIVSQASSNVTSPEGNLEDIPQDSICSEFKSQYLVLIDKYEKLSAANEEREEQLRLQKMVLQNQQQVSDLNVISSDHHNTSYRSSNAEEISGPMSLVLPNETNCGTHMKCQRCANCSCGITGARPKSNMEEYSEVETSSSGFSEGEGRLINKLTQTEHSQANIDDVNPTEFVMTFAKFLDLKSPENPCVRRFNSTPEYKKLFHEIFTVLKETVHANESKHQLSIGGATHDDTESHLDESICDEELSSVDNELAALAMESSSTRTVCTTTSGDSVCSTPNAKYMSKQEVVNMLKNASNALNTEIDRKTPPGKDCTSSPLTKDPQMSHIMKPLRPNSLDLVSNASSRSSSKNRRRKSRQKSRKLNESSEKTDEETKIVTAQISRTLTSVPLSVVMISADTCSSRNDSSASEVSPKHRQNATKKRNRRNRSKNTSIARPSTAPPQNIVEYGARKSVEYVKPALPQSNRYAQHRSPPQHVVQNRPQQNQQSYSKYTQNRALSQGYNNMQSRTSSRPRGSPSHQSTAKRFDQRRTAQQQQFLTTIIQAPPPPPQPAVIALPSVHLEQLRQLDQTYADVLKTKLNFRSHRTAR